jgi:NADH-quinone oxidoreductase subunit L
MALVQNDIKRVLAYSTVSQIGYMFIGCGAGAYAAGIFHLFTHAFFKSLLFLGAGSVIHALSGEQDIRKMGGLRRHLPRTFPAFLIAALAIAGLPFLSGFFSKDGILTAAFAGGRYDLWALGLLGAVLTAFYMFRLVFLVFYGEERLGDGVRGHVHESPSVMTTPLLILAFFSAAAGYVGLPVVLGERADLIGRFLEPALISPEKHHLAGGTEWLLLLISAGLAVTGILIAYTFYIKRPQLPAAAAARFPKVYKLLVNKYYVDEAYAAVLLKPAERGAEAVYRNFDLKVIDGALDGSAAAAREAGKLAGRLQSGLVKDYVLAFLAGAILFLGVLLL